MRVLVAPDKFAGTLTAVEAAQAIATGWARQAPADELDLAPMSDGGPGFVHVLHAALVRPGRRGVIASVLEAYRHRSLERPNRYRLATSGPLRRDLLPDCLEEWAGQPFFFATGDPFRSQALWSFAHGMVVLEIDGRYPDDSDLTRTWRAGADAFAG